MNIHTAEFLEIHPENLLTIKSIGSAHQYDELQSTSHFLLGWGQAEIEGIADPMPELYSVASGHIYKLLRDYEFLHSLDQ